MQDALKAIIFFLDLDVDECLNVGSNQCDANATCANTEGSYVCQCREGYEGEGKKCTGTDKSFLITLV